ncbi:MAG: TRAP transporter fused permease subunit, partial [Gammaproteobacteria bacterium]
HSGTPINSFLGTLTIAEGGLWGSLAGISVGIVAIFVILGAVLNAGAAGQGFMNVASAAAGRLKGGAAKVSIISSALFGSISGSASANVASTGAITMPAMLKLGYPPRLTAAVEAVASSGGQIMPPLMGAGAFVMVELTGTPYAGVMAAALLPAILYFAAVWFGINGYTSRYDLKPVPEEQRPSPKAVLTTSAFFLVPFFVLLWFMLGVGYTPQYAAVLAIGIAFSLLLFDADLKINSRSCFHRIEAALLAAASQIAMIASIILCASIIIGVLGITGLGVKVTSLIMSGSSGLLWPALILTAVACLILGMEVPTTAAYVICVSVAGPALIDLGMAPLQAHLFVFWFALISTITPPVCGAVFIASGMIGANWVRVSLTAMTLGIGLYLIPLAIAADISLIGLGFAPGEAVLAGARVALGLWLVSKGLVSGGSALRRAGLLSAGIGITLFGFH